MTKPKTKYDCPFYQSKGGHCKKTSFNIAGYMHCVYGCKHPNDITKCGWVQKLLKESPFIRG